MIAAGLMAFFPNVWFFGGAGFSDVPSIVLVIYAVAFLFRGCRDTNAYFIGSFLLAMSVGIRPQNLLVGIFPLAISTWYRARASLRDVAFALMICSGVVFVSYASAIHATGAGSGVPIRLARWTPCVSVLIRSSGLRSTRVTPPALCASVIRSASSGVSNNVTTVDGMGFPSFACSWSNFRAKVCPADGVSGFQNQP